MSTAASHIRAGYHAVTPFLTVRDAARAIRFLQGRIWRVELSTRLTDPAGKILVAEIRIGDSMLLEKRIRPSDI